MMNNLADNVKWTSGPYTPYVQDSKTCAGRGGAREHEVAVHCLAAPISCLRQRERGREVVLWCGSGDRVKASRECRRASRGARDADRPGQVVGPSCGRVRSLVAKAVQNDAYVILPSVFEEVNLTHASNSKASSPSTPPPALCTRFCDPSDGRPISSCAPRVSFSV